MTYFIILAVSIIIFYVARHFLKKSDRSTNSTTNNRENITENEIPLTLTPKQFSEKYNHKQGQVKGGTLCFWGHWFGKPHDNYHQIIKSHFDIEHNILTIQFSERETLTVTNPGDIEEYKNRFQIDTADKVYWQWYYYGKTQENENLLYYSIIKNGDNVNGETNANWYKADWSDLTSTKPAVLFT